MAVPEQVPYIEHIGNGVSKQFSLGFDCDTKDRLVVRLNDTAVYFPEWSFSNGFVIFQTAPKSGDKISIRRQTKFERETNYKSYDNSLSPSALNKDFDVIWWALQELNIADRFLSVRIDELIDYVDQQDESLSQRIENLKTFILREESFLELVASTTFPEPNMIFGLYTTARKCFISSDFPHNAYIDSDEEVHIGVYVQGDKILNIRGSKSGCVFEWVTDASLPRNKRIEFKIDQFHHSLRKVALTLIGKFPFYDMG
ncbi:MULTISPECIES: hypothetical protein [Acinetobacter]|uniref:Uncharacterized protein n=1 Tax=Acinetobacter bouvetii TaxID=202951 RepID=A0A4V2DNS7_9GAMM|nr:MULTISPECIES: hypothetical protein [Acinetobacter]RZG64135.1 hypothetical protein EXE25_17520 [Acinetobacter bouvetii]TCB77001.1 hypothetical protein E0H91_01715 [Acinetobacter sp. ANC 4177]